MDFTDRNRQGVNPNDISDSLDDAKALVRLARDIDVRLSLAEDREDMTKEQLEELEEFAREAAACADDIVSRVRTMLFDLEVDQ